MEELETTQELETQKGEVECLTATVESISAAQVEALTLRVEAAEQQIRELQAAAAIAAQSQPQLSNGRRTLPAATSTLLAKHGVNESGAMDVGTLDSALTSLPVDQRIAIKSQLLRAGLLG